jgi:hypothetical protein
MSAASTCEAAASGLMCDDPAAVSAWLRSQGERVGTNCTVTLDLRAAAPPFAETFDGDGESFAPHHYEQLTTVSGALALGDVSTDVNGFGLRDHSWGPRSWQAPYFYRWVHGSTDGLGFIGAYFGDAGGSDRVDRRGRNDLARDVRVPGSSSRRPAGRIEGLRSRA